jgi:multimeric flavodoxin WrbA
MKVVAINGSPKAKGNTFTTLNTLADLLAPEGVTTKILQVGSAALRGCIACNGCARNQDRRCVLPDDQVNGWIDTIAQADGLILGSPVYFSAVPGTLKCFLDRAFYVQSTNGGLFRHKVGAAVVADRRAGAVSTFGQLNNYLHYAEMFVPSSNYWNVVYGTAPGEVAQDTEGQQILRVLAKNLAWMLKSRRDSPHALPEAEPKVLFNFIR